MHIHYQFYYEIQQTFYEGIKNLNSNNPQFISPTKTTLITPLILHLNLDT